MKHFISFCTFLLFSTLLFAQAERSLDECIRIAWKQNPSLRNSGIDIKEARMDYISSVASFLPRVSVSAEAGRNFGRSIAPNTNRNRSEWALKERRNELACQVTDAYYKLLLEERMLDLALEQSRLSERYLKQTEAFVELGLKSVSDLQEVKARREGDIYRYQARQNGCRLALLRLKQLLNLHDEDTLAVQDTINYELLSAYPLPQTEELYTQSLVAMPSMRMMELRQRAARKEYAMAGGKFSPTVFARFSMASRYLDGFSTKQLNDNLGKYIGIGISIPLLSGLERLTTLRKHKLNIFRLRNEEELQKQQLYTEVEQTVLSLRSGYDEFRQVLQQFRAEELVLKESERKWEEGLISVFQLMEARNRFISSKAELARVRLQVDMTLKMETYYRTGSFCTLPGEE